MAEVARLIPWLAGLKYNHLQLYTEHTFAYAGHDAVWQGWSPITPDELRTIDGWCREAGIVLAANQNCFGHLSGWLRHPAYRHLSEMRPGERWDFNGLVTREGPFSLCPIEPAAAGFVTGLLDQLLPCVGSRLVNIGCDETFDVGQGRSRVAVAERGRSAVYMDFVQRICQAVIARGCTPLLWADIALEHPEVLAALPAAAIGLAWGYEPDAAFATWCRQIQSAGHAAWVCPGTSCWRSITGRSSERRGNLQAAARDGRAAGAEGFLVTVWGDCGHLQQWPITAYALADAAQGAWTGSAGSTPEAAAGRLCSRPGVAPRLGRWLERLGDADLALRRSVGRPDAEGRPRALRNATALFTDLQREAGDPPLAAPAAWQEVAHRLAELDGMPAVPGQLGAEIAHAHAVAVAAVQRAVRRAGGSVHAASGAVASWSDLALEHGRLWLRRSRPGGLEDSLGRYRALARAASAAS
jgi:hexosaminidase